MPSVDPSLAAKNPDVQVKRASWLELYFDLIFALALAMSAKPLEHISGFTWGSVLELGQFILIFTFLVLFWLKHTNLINRFDHNNFLLALITLLSGFLIITFTQFIRVWRIDPQIGSFGATITLSILTISIACLYFLSSIKIVDGGANEKIWARVSAKNMLKEAAAYLLALFIAPGFTPFWFIAVFIFFHRYAFITWINPTARPNVAPELMNVPPIVKAHKTERIGIFSLLVYGLVIILAATPLLELNKATSVEEIIAPIIVFGQIFFFISLMWYLFYRLIELAKPQGHQFTALNFVNLALLVAATQFIRIMLVEPSSSASIFFGVTVGLMLSVMAVGFFNVQKMQGLPMQPRILGAFRQWAYLLYGAAGAFLISVFFPFKETIWDITLLILFVGLLLDYRLTVKYYMGTRVKKQIKFMDQQTMGALTFIILGLIGFFILTTLLAKPLISIWILVWIIPLLIGFFMLLNHWLNTRIRPV